MKRAIRQVIVLLASWFAAGIVAGTDLSGHYVSDSGPSLTLTLQELSNGVITGTIAEPGESLPLNARRQENGFEGTAGRTLPLTATLKADRLIVNIGAGDVRKQFVFKRIAVASRGTTPSTGSRNVLINNRRLSDAELQMAEQKYRIRIPDGDYWYDRVLGAWGVRGGPTQGFIAPFLNLGGPLAANASGGGTAIFVNGRALHPQDVMALQQITGPIMPGRYFITAQGLAGYEGGAPLWNLAAMGSQARGGSSNWQSRVTGASGFSDGTTGAVFLPGGGIVSTGR